MRVYFANEDGNTITEYYHVVPVIPICPIVEMNSSDQSYTGTITVNDVPFVTLSQNAYESGVYTYSNEFKNLLYRFTSNTDKIHVVKAIVTVTNEDGTTTTLNATFTAYYKASLRSLFRILGDFNNYNKYHTVRNKIFDKANTTLVSLKQILARLEGNITYREYTRPTQYIQHILKLYKSPYKDNSIFSLSDKIFYIHKDTYISTTILAADILKDASIDTLVIDSVYRTNNCTVILNKIDNVTSSITVKPISTSVLNTSCILCINDTNTNIRMYIDIIFIQKFIPAIQAGNITVSFTQWESISIPFTDMYAASYGSNLTFVQVMNGSIKRGNVTVDNINKLVTFKGTGLTGEDTGFQYQLRAQDNYTSIGTVTCNVQRLSDIQAYFYSTTAAANAFMADNTPPSLSTIFNSWNRFSNGNKYYPSGTTPEGEATRWQMISENQFACTINSSYITGFISPKTYENYVHEVTLSSTNGDDDVIGVVLAFKRVGTVNHVLTVIRHPGGGWPPWDDQKQWALLYHKLDAENMTHFVIKAGPIANVVHNGAPGENVSGYGWDAQSPTRIYIQRSGDVFSAKCTQWKTTSPYLAGSQITFDLSTDSEMYNLFHGACQYGYMCESQNASSYSDVNFTGGLDQYTVTNLQTNKVYKYANNKWTASSDTPQSLYGYPRTVTNPKTGERFEIRQNSVVKLT